MTFSYERPIRFEEVDAARIVFFARFLNYAHEAMEALLGGLDGGYVRLVNERRIGMPAVHVSCDFRAPLRFGDVARIETRASRIGNKSVTFRYEFFRKHDGTHVATVEHVCAVTDLDAMRAIAVPDDVRALLEKCR
ncbi:MAG TPA: thioesterase family protein [Polyangiaceae bacterium]|jgi:4-hydroxybenzoyl-CoA thioesterase